MRAPICVTDLSRSVPHGLPSSVAFAHDFSPQTDDKNTALERLGVFGDKDHAVALAFEFG